MKIRQKLILSYIAIAVLPVVTGIAMLIQLNKIVAPLYTDISEAVEEVSRASRLDSLAQFIRYYDEVLTQSVRNYAFTQDKKWKQRYKEAEPQLDRMIKEAINLGGRIDKEFFLEVDAANLALVEMEYKAIGFVDNKEAKEAIKILESRAYWDQKAIYKQGLKSYIQKRGAEYDQALLASTEAINMLGAKEEKRLKANVRTLLIFSIVSFALAITLAILLSRLISTPIMKLKTMTEKIGSGDVDYKVKIKTGDEIQDLADSFNQMTVALGNKQKEILEEKAKAEEFAKTLERRVKERTRDLEQVQAASLNIMEDLQKTKVNLQKKSEELEKALAEALKAREIMVSMLEDNNEVRAKLEIKVRELQEAEKALVKFEKFASLGRLAADMAHEVNNPLMIISGRAQLSLMEEIENEEIKESLRIILDQCNRAKDIMQRLLKFSKPTKSKTAVININRSLEFILSLVEYQYSINNIEVKREFAPTLPVIKGNDKQLHEVFMNVITNAAQAMPEGGTLTIKTYTKKLTQPAEGVGLRKGDVFKPGDSVIVVEIKDTGGGIPKSELERIYDPFYTTKEKGTGLGLSVCYGIIKSHGGIISHSSQVGKGTVATIILPIAQEGGKT